MPATRVSLGCRSAAASSRSSPTRTRAYFGDEAGSQDQVGHLEGGTARFGKTYAGEPEQLVKDLAEDEPVAAADTLLITVTNQLGVDYNAHLIESLLRHVAPELGWR
jgi:alkanesulfonate monooxygenase SsuD/methylene tetrahydromethanopterin reductase-like flavin-dependent oxidoreductase (luciferase family)